MQVFVAMVLFFATHGLARVVYPLLLVKATGSVESGAYAYGMLVGGGHFCAFLVANPILGTLSDYRGKRIFLMVPFLGLAFELILITAAPTLLSFAIGAAVKGCTNCFVAVASSALVELSPAGHTGKNMGLVGMAYGLGAGVGTLCGGALGLNDLRTPFVVATAFAGLGILWVLLVIPPLNRAAKSNQPFINALNPFANFSMMMQTSELRLLALIFLLHRLGMGTYEIWILYSKYKFNWNTFDQGLFMFVFGITVMGFQGVVVRWILHDRAENSWLRITLVCSALELVIIAFIESTWLLYSVIFVFAVSNAAWPAMMGIVTRHVAPSEQGQLQGAIGCIHTFAEIIWPLVASEIFGSMVAFERELGVEPGSTPLPGLPFVLGGLWVAAAAAVWWQYGTQVDEVGFALRDARARADTDVKVFQPAESEAEGSV